MERAQFRNGELVARYYEEQAEIDFTNCTGNDFTDELIVRYPGQEIQVPWYVVSEALLHQGVKYPYSPEDTGLWFLYVFLEDAEYLQKARQQHIAKD